jgi:hypothetical protein
MIWVGMEKSKRLFAISGLMVLIGGGIAVAQTATKIEPAELERLRRSNAQCLDCHSGPGLQALVRPDVDKAALTDRLVDPDAFLRSNHGNVECVACHVTGFKEFPHAEAAKQQINNCDECHTRQFLRIEDQFAKSVHAKMAEAQPGSFTCITCHDPHVFLKTSHFSTTRQAVRQDNDMCLQCHASDERFAQLTKDARPDLQKIHASLPNTPLHWAAVRCVECHTPVPKTILSHEILPAERAERNCVACHSANSTLRVRLYRHLVEEERETVGFINSVILNEAYVIGATRNRYLDMAFGVVAAAVVGGIALHGLARVVAGLRRRRPDG